MTTHTLIRLSGNMSLVLCPDHRSDAMMWLWQEFEGAWTATVTGYGHCDACAPGANVPAAFRAAVHRQRTPQAPGLLGSPPVFRDAPRTLSPLS